MKTKKILAALLSSAMVLGTLAVPVFADSTGNWIDSAVTNWEGDGTKDNPYQISSAAQLAGLAKEIKEGTAPKYGYVSEEAPTKYTAPYKNKYFKLMNDIDLAGKEWTPIGTDSSNYFAGVFDGNGKTISNLTINAASTDNVGLFGYINDPSPVGSLPESQTGDRTTVKNLTIENVDITGQRCVGALGGGFYRCTLSEVKVCGSIKIEGNYKVGGVIGDGYSNGSKLTVEGDAGSSITGTYNGENLEGDNIGGAVGYVAESGLLTNNYTYDNIKVSGVTVKGTRKVGGVFGFAYTDDYITNVTVSNVTVGTNADVDYANDNPKTMGIGGVVGQYHIDSNRTDGKITDVAVSGVTLTNENKVTVSMGYITGGQRGQNPPYLPNIDTVGNITVGTGCTGTSNDYLVTKVTGGEYKVDVQKYLPAGLAEKEDNGTYTVIPLSEVVPNLTGVVTIKSAVEDKKYEQVSAVETDIQGGSKDFKVKTSGDGEQNIDKTITLKDIGYFEGSVLCGLIIKNIPEGVTVTVTE